MCASCGCRKFEEQHGDDRNITMSDLRSAAEAAGISVQEVARNILEAAGGQNQDSPTNGSGQTQEVRR